VHLGWYKDPAALNKRRADTVALIQASCDQAGFRVVDAGSPTFLDQEWVDGNYDVALLFWTGSPLVAGAGDFFTSAAGNNTTGYASSQVDQLARSLAVEADPGQQIRLLLQIDRQLWTDLVTIPLFAFPAVLATATDVDGVRFNATAAGVTWNLAEWTRG
jgi:peptide/nickel transport system substrate-binding protein